MQRSRCPIAFVQACGQACSHRSAGLESRGYSLELFKNCRLFSVGAVSLAVFFSMWACWHRLVTEFFPCDNRSPLAKPVSTFRPPSMSNPSPTTPTTTRMPTTRRSRPPTKGTRMPRERMPRERMQATRMLGDTRKEKTREARKGKMAVTKTTMMSSPRRRRSSATKRTARKRKATKMTRARMAPTMAKRLVVCRLVVWQSFLAPHYRIVQLLAGPFVESCWLAIVMNIRADWSGAVVCISKLSWQSPPAVLMSCTFPTSWDIFVDNCWAFSDVLSSYQPLCSI